jgi:hypothetical protein
MISAKEPFGGALDGAAVGFGGVAFAGAAFGIAPGPFLGTGLGDAGLELGAEADFATVLGAPDGAGALLLDGVPVFGPSGRDGRGSWSSALRFIPPLAFPVAAGRGVRVAGLRSTFLTVEDVAGGAGG